MTAIIVIAMLIFIVIRVPIAIAMGLSGVIYFMFSGIPMETMIQKVMGGANSFEMTAIPLFVLAGEIMNCGGISKRLINFANSLIGHFRGGLGMATVLACMIFGGPSGSVLAEIAAIGPITIPAMAKQGYNKGFAAAIVGVASELGPIIPPSIHMVIVASIVQLSVGKMLLSGVIPGILIGLGLMLVVYIISIKRGYPKQIPPRASMSQLLKDTIDGLIDLLMPVILIVGMVSGIFTATETAGVTVLYGLIVATLIHKELKLKDLYQACLRSAITSGAIMFVVCLANVYSYMLTMLNVSNFIADVAMSVKVSPQFTMILLLLLLIPLGMILSSTPALMLIAPVLVLLPGKLGIDPIMFFSVVTMATLIGTLTPPVCLSLYLVAKIANTRIEETFAEMLPLILVIYIVLIMCIFIPALTTWLPNISFQ